MFTKRVHSRISGLELVAQFVAVRNEVNGLFGKIWPFDVDVPLLRSHLEVITVACMLTVDFPPSAWILRRQRQEIV